MVQHGDEYRDLIDVNDEPKRDKETLKKWREKIQVRINEAREKYTKRYNLKTRRIDYKVGDVVYRKKYLTKKFMPKRRQCIIVAKTGTNTYTLKEISSGKLHECHAMQFCR